MTTNEVTRRQPISPAPLNLGSLSDPAELGRMLAASGYFQDVKEAAQAVVKVLAGAELGIPPIAAMTGVFIVKGRVTLSANLIAAVIRRHPTYDFDVKTWTAERCEIVFTRNGAALEPPSTFTIKDAQTAGLSGGENWKKYPRNMLFARAMSNGAKLHCPDAFAGAPIYTPDELGAAVDPETGEILAVPERVPSEPLPAPRPKPEPAPEPPEPKPPEPDPAPAPVEQPAQTAPPDARDEDEQINNEEFAKLVELLDALKVPEHVRRMAVLGNGVDDLAQLTRAQARKVAETVQARFGT